MEDRISREHQEVAQGEYQPNAPSSDSYRSGFVKVTSSTSVSTLAMTVRDFVVEVVAVENYTLAITLPPVVEAKGKIYTIFCSAHGESSCDVTVNDAGDETIFNVAGGADSGGTAVTLAYVDNYVVLFSNGIRWFVLNSFIIT